MAELVFLFGHQLGQRNTRPSLSPGIGHGRGSGIPSGRGQKPGQHGGFTMAGHFRYGRGKQCQLDFSTEIFWGGFLVEWDQIKGSFHNSSVQRRAEASAKAVQTRPMSPNRLLVFTK